MNKNNLFLLTTLLFLTPLSLGKEFFLKKQIIQAYPKSEFKQQITNNYFKSYFDLHQMNPDGPDFQKKLIEHNKSRACLFFFSRKMDMDNINRFGNKLIKSIQGGANYKKVEEKIIGSLKAPVENVQDQFYDGFKACPFAVDQSLVETYRKDFSFDGVLKMNIDPVQKIELAFWNRPYLKQAFTNYYLDVNKTNSIKEINNENKKLMIQALKSGQCLEAVSFSTDLMDLTQLLSNFKKGTDNKTEDIREKFFDTLKDEKEKILEQDPISMCNFPIKDSDKEDLRRLREEDYNNNLALYRYFVQDREVFHPKFQSLIKNVESKVDMKILDEAHAAISFNQLMIMQLNMIDLIYGRIIDLTDSKCIEKYSDLFQNCFKDEKYSLIPHDTLRKVLCIEGSNSKLSRECQITYDEPEL